jgi:hypothetical protein
MIEPIVVGYDPRRADHAPLEFGVAAAELTGAQLLVHDDLLPDCSKAIEEIEPDLRALDIRVDCLKVRSSSAARRFTRPRSARTPGCWWWAPRAGRRPDGCWPGQRPSGCFTAHRAPSGSYRSTGRAGAA